MDSKRFLGLIAISFLIILEFNILAEGKHYHKIEENEEEILRDNNYEITVGLDNSDYKSIQEAIDHASTGSKIYIRKGTYYEIIDVNKYVKLVGEDKEKTIISPTSSKNSYAIQIRKPNVEIKDLSISNKGPGIYTTGLKIIASNTIVDNCLFYDNPVGIACWSSNNQILNSNFYECKDEGIVFLGSKNNICNKNTVKNCVFYDNCDGIELQYSSYNVIKNCKFYDNFHAGIDAIGKENNENIISDCKFYNNEAYGIYISRSSDNLILDCTVDSITTKDSENTVENSEVDNILLYDNSKLNIKNCKNIQTSNIRSLYSSYELTNENTQNTGEKQNFRNRFIQRIFALLSDLKVNIKNFLIEKINI